MSDNILSFAAGVALGVFAVWLYDKFLIISCRLDNLETVAHAPRRTDIQSGADTDDLDDNEVKGCIGFKGGNK